MASRVHLLASKLHKWIALLIGLQFLAWTVGGFVMSWLPIELVRGEGNRAEPALVALPQEHLARLASQIDGAARLAGRQIGERLAVEVTFGTGSVSLFDLRTAEPLSPLVETDARSVAVADFTGAGRPVEAALLTEEPGDYRGPLPVWQVRFDDPDNTRIYVKPDDGRVLARRNDYWRFYDFFWMLHIMDYEGRENFNNPLIMIAALSAVLFVASGFILVYHRFHRRDFGLAKKKKR